MEEVTFQAVQVLLILLPGFVTSRVVLALTVRPSVTDLDKIIEALFYSFAVYVICLMTPWANPIAVQVTGVPGQHAGQTFEFERALRNFVFSAFAVAVALGLAISFV